mmetsp:Transcript_46775/g.130244  ORF Transcript_46775/g.130244 Transcript_46775/m.130244 type:complete len:303 (-) Transcript_46775:239-1147(-)
MARNLPRVEACTCEVINVVPAIVEMPDTLPWDLDALRPVPCEDALHSPLLQAVVRIEHQRRGSGDSDAPAPSRCVGVICRQLLEGRGVQHPFHQRPLHPPIARATIRGDANVTRAAGRTVEPSRRGSGKGEGPGTERVVVGARHRRSSRAPLPAAPILNVGIHLRGYRAVVVENAEARRLRSVNGVASESDRRIRQRLRCRWRGSVRCVCRWGRRALSGAPRTPARRPKWEAWGVWPTPWSHAELAVCGRGPTMIGVRCASPALAAARWRGQANAIGRNVVEGDLTRDIQLAELHLLVVRAF